ncbi:MAG: MOSC domain-containing protein [Burkholderiales bacterium]|nr:MOSC domain-containing protein [Burkholderiales bacterium]
MGDTLHFADCVLRVTAPRQPCFKFNAVMGFVEAARLMVREARCGFYLAVEQTGALQVGERFTLRAGSRALSVTELNEKIMSDAAPTKAKNKIAAFFIATPSFEILVRAF